MQRIWDKQKQEPLYAINEAALHKRIQSIGGKSNLFANILEWGLIIGGLLGAIPLIPQTIEDNLAWPAYAAIVVVLAAVVYTVFLRVRRARSLTQFDASIVGDLNKALAQNEYVIEKGRSLFYWYILPVFGAYITWFIVAGVNPIFIVLMLVMGVVSYFGAIWEINSWHQPRQQDLLKLRELIAQAQ